MTTQKDIIGYANGEFIYGEFRTIFSSGNVRIISTGSAVFAVYVGGECMSTHTNEADARAHADMWLTPLSANHPPDTKRVGEYDPTTGQYPAYVSIDGTPEQCIGHAWSAGAADRLCDAFLYDHYTDANTPEVAARIAVGVGEPTPSEAEPSEPQCPACQGQHHIQRCPVIGALLLARATRLEAVPA